MYFRQDTYQGLANRSDQEAIDRLLSNLPEAIASNIRADLTRHAPVQPFRSMRHDPSTSMAFWIVCDADFLNIMVLPGLTRQQFNAMWEYIRNRGAERAGAEALVRVYIGIKTGQVVPDTVKLIEASPPPHYYVLTDESGISANESLTLVAALIARSDTAARTAVSMVRALIDERVPATLRKDYVFHVLQLQNDKSIRDIWPGVDRFRFICDMASIAYKAGIPIAYAFSTRDRVFEPLRGRTREEVLHTSAFGRCMATADQWIREDCELDATAQIYAEDIPERRRSLVQAYHRLRASALTIPPEDIVRGSSIRGAHTGQAGLRLSIEKIAGPIVFAKKGQVELLQVVDAVAYGLRRYFSRLARGDEYWSAMTGGAPTRVEVSPSNIDSHGLMGPDPRSREGIAVSAARQESILRRR